MEVLHRFLPAETPRKKKNRKSISLAVKLQVINRIQSGERASCVARSLGLPPSTVRTIHKDADRIRECSENASCLSSKVISRKRSKIMERLEFELCQWIQMMVDRNVDVSMAMIQEKALEIFGILQDEAPDGSPDKQERFTASRGWFDRFRKRQNIHSSGFGYEKVAIGSERYLYQEDNITLAETYNKRKSDHLRIQAADDQIEGAEDYLDFQMVVDESDNTEDAHYIVPEQVNLFGIFSPLPS